MNNTIHIIRFTPRKYKKPNALQPKLLQQNGKFLLLENGQKILL
jgi:hypothetical protein